MPLGRALAALWLATPAGAEGVAGVFDYYVLSLSWSPSWCHLEGEERGSPQCEGARAFVLHGLWPQYERGWPDYCETSERGPSRAQTAAREGLYGDDDAAYYQWRKHGVCSGLGAEAFYDLSAEAFGRVALPEVLTGLGRAVTLPAELVEEAFLEANPALEPDGVTITCKSGMIQEVRVCLTRDLAFRRCGADVIRDCTLDDALMLPPG
ncbi:ribonuclease T2 family protein [Pseudoroseicyclus tamaricis]|uniref:Ribonuclease T2 n=1 Tax=Pseudoroseicyclus tamaricis TaxID=2705421 RepID=A0A6B2JL15_9RHOB|nr:ribonuclease T2 [Pseudoroseicyclus tamaricis]NDV02231.1 ribonuclease T2 [Pseudoroseicyclus tamaricis]